MISYALGSFGKHLKNRQIPYQSVRGPLVPSLNCVCGAIENNKHYLLDCHRYVNARDEMLNLIIGYLNVTADILLFGNTDLPVQINEEIFKAVYAYIRKTRRFMS